jgi:hypothetical protein
MPPLGVALAEERQGRFYHKCRGEDRSAVRLSLPSNSSPNVLKIGKTPHPTPHTHEKLFQQTLTILIDWYHLKCPRESQNWPIVNRV